MKPNEPTAPATVPAAISRREFVLRLQRRAAFVVPAVVALSLSAPKTARGGY